MKIKWLVLDVDGVLTDGKLTYTTSGEELKSFCAQDGLGITAARKVGLKIGIITGRQSTMVKRRSQELNIDFLAMGSHNKSGHLHQLCEAQGINTCEIAYMGDDLNDLAVSSMAGLTIAPQNACKEMKDRADYVTQHCGGDGAVREAIEYILKEEGLWLDVVKHYEAETYDFGQ